jgi:ferric-dicitrate binding protein FerR (iron transport regulator)
MKPGIDIENSRFSNLENFQSIDAEADWQHVKGRMGFGPKRTVMRFRWAAAAAILLFSAGFLARHYMFSPGEMLVVRAGDDPEMVILPDGSTVSLNATAELSYPEEFSRNKRELRLSGEAFFEVERDPRRPFIVQVGTDATVEVLGTSFNIKPDPGIGSIVVQVVEGSVVFRGILPTSLSVVLHENEQATMQGGNILKEESLELNMYSWKTRILVFDQDLIGDVARHLSTCYRIDVVLKDDVPNELTFTSTIDNQDLEEVLEEVSMVLGLEYTIGEDRVVISKPN